MKLRCGDITAFPGEFDALKDAANQGRVTKSWTLRTEKPRPSTAASRLSCAGQRNVDRGSGRLSRLLSADAPHPV